MAQDRWDGPSFEEFLRLAKANERSFVQEYPGDPFNVQPECIIASVGHSAGAPLAQPAPPLAQRPRHVVVDIDPDGPSEADIIRVQLYYGAPIVEWRSPGMPKGWSI